MCAVRPARLSAARASENPRRNRCFQSSVLKVASVSQETKPQRCPLTDGRDAVSRAAVKGPIPMWGFHTDREDDPEGHLAKVKGV